MFEWLERRFKSAHLNSLEAEVKRLRDENRQLMNSILASHGMGQIEGPRSEKASQPIPRRDWISYARRKESESRRPPAVEKDIPNAASR